MFSKRLCKLTNFLNKLCNYLGASAGYFNPKTKTYHRNIKQEWKVKLINNLCLFWAAAALYIVIKYFKQKDINRYNLTLAYWLAGILAVSVISIVRWFPHDICIGFNGSYHFLRHLYGKFATLCVLPILEK